MSSSQRVNVYLSQEIINAINAAAAAEGLQPGSLMRQILSDYATKASAGTSPEDAVEWFLRPGSLHMEASWENGGRWLLEWFLRREPDWQRHHLVTLPRHWPIPLNTPETRCWSNGGDRRSVNDHLHDLAASNRIPKRLGDGLTPGQWLDILARFRGCCGERIRAPQAPHWGPLCPAPSALTTSPQPSPVASS